MIFIFLSLLTRVDSLVFTFARFSFFSVPAKFSCLLKVFFSFLTRLSFFLLTFFFRCWVSAFSFSFYFC